MYKKFLSLIRNTFELTISQYLPGTLCVITFWLWLLQFITCNANLTVFYLCSCWPNRLCSLLAFSSFQCQCGSYIVVFICRFFIITQIILDNLALKVQHGIILDILSLKIQHGISFLLISFLLSGRPSMVYVLYFWRWSSSLMASCVLWMDMHVGMSVVVLFAMMLNFMPCILHLCFIRFFPRYMVSYVEVTSLFVYCTFLMQPRHIVLYMPGNWKHRYIYLYLHLNGMKESAFFEVTSLLQKKLQVFIYLELNYFLSQF